MCHVEGFDHFCRKEARLAEKQARQIEEEKQGREKLRLEKEKLKEQALLETTTRLHQGTYSKRIDEMTYNIEPHTTSDRRFEISISSVL